MHDTQAPRRGPAGSRTAIAITAVIVTAVVVAGGLATALPGRNSVKADDIASNAVRTRHIADDAISPDAIADGAIQREALDDSLKSYWARVESGSGGTSATLRIGSGVATASRVTTGVYLVRFETDITFCAWIATLNDASTGIAPAGEISVEQASAATPTDLFVRTFSSAGAAADLGAGDGFSVMVNCEQDGPIL